MKYGCLTWSLPIDFGYAAIIDVMNFVVICSSGVRNNYSYIYRYTFSPIPIK